MGEEHWKVFNCKSIKSLFIDYPWVEQLLNEPMCKLFGLPVKTNKNGKCLIHTLLWLIFEKMTY